MMKIQVVGGEMAIAMEVVLQFQVSFAVMWVLTAQTLLISWVQWKLSLLWSWSTMLLWLSVISVFAGIGEHTREGNDMYREIIENGFCLLLTWGRSWSIWSNVSSWPAWGQAGFQERGNVMYRHVQAEAHCHVPASQVEAHV
jgi:hypothetical protein